MKRTKILALALAAALVIVPLGALAQGWFGSAPRERTGQIHSLAADAGDAADAQGGHAQQGSRCARSRRVIAGGLLHLLNMSDEQIDQLAERLNLSDQETDQLKTSISEAKPLRDELKDKLEEIRDIIGPKIREKLQENNQQCKSLLDQAKQIRDDLRNLFSDLKTAVRQGDDETASQIKDQIKQDMHELRDIIKQMRQNHCLCGRKLGRINSWRGKLAHRWGPHIAGQRAGQGEENPEGSG